MKFQIEKKFLNQVEEKGSDKRILSKSELDKIKQDNPNTPESFLNYLAEIGAGNIRESQFVVQPYLFNFDDIGLDEIYNISHNIKFFGDNFNGDFAGFDLSQKKDEVVEFLHESEELYYTKKTFHEFIREQMLISDEGNDLRI